MMPNIDPSAVGASMGPGDPLSTMYVGRLANQQSATANAPNLYGGQAQPSYSDMNQGSASTGYTQGATRGESLYGNQSVGAATAGVESGSAVSARYGDQGAKNALTEEEGATHKLFRQVYTQTWAEENQDGNPNAE